MSATVLPPKEFRREMARMPAVFPAVFEGVTDPRERDRKASDCLNSMKIYERADYGPLTDVRELIALRIAPWLHR